MKITVREGLSAHEFAALDRAAAEAVKQVEASATDTVQFAKSVSALMDQYGVEGYLRLVGGDFLDGFLQLHLTNFTHNITISAGIGERMAQSLLSTYRWANDGSPFVAMIDIQGESPFSRECKTLKALLDTIEGYFKEWTE